MNTITSRGYAALLICLVSPAFAARFTNDRHTRSAGISSYDMAGVWSDMNENRARS